MNTLPLLGAILGIVLPGTAEVSLPAWREQMFSGEDA